MINTKPRKGSNSSEKLNVLVAVRVRPLNEEERAKSQNVVKADTITKLISCKNKQFGPFDYVYPPSSTQSDVFENVCMPQVKKVLAGFNCTVFAYGQTGTGKTYTMEGGHAESDSAEADVHTGMTPRAVELIFAELENAGVEEYSVRVSYLELYNEEIYDLLSSGTEEREKLRIFDDPSKKGAVIVSGAEELPVRSRKEVYDILKRGTDKRTTAATLMNTASSRSHSIFTISVVIRENTESGEELVKTGKLNLVDLAGSENIGRSGAEGKRMKEAGNINQSLLTLSRVITALTSSGPHIPYRESKLTRILQDSLGGSTITAIIATMSPSQSNYEESISTLDYAMRAKSIRNHPECNQKVSRKALLKEYNIEIEKLRRDLRMAREKNGIFISEETYNDMEKDIAVKNELAAKMDIMVAKLQRFIEDMEMMDEQYMAAYQTNKRLQSKLETRVQELDLTKKDLAICQQKLSAYQYALDDFSEVAKSCHQQAKQACKVTGQQRALIEELWKKDEEMVQLASTNKDLVFGSFAKLYSYLSMSVDVASNFVDNISQSAQNKLIDSESFQVSIQADLEVITSILKNVSSNINQFNTNIKNSVETTESNIQTIVAEKSKTMSSLFTDVGQAIESHAVKTSELANSFNDMVNRIKSLTNDLVKDSEAIVADNREHVGKYAEEHNNVIQSMSTTADEHKALMENMLKSFYEQGMQALSTFKSAVDTKTSKLQELNVNLVDNCADIDERLRSTVQGSEDNILEVIGEIEVNAQCVASNTGELTKTVTDKNNTGSQVLEDCNKQLISTYGAFRDNIYSLADTDLRNQITLIETGESANVRAQTSITDEAEELRNYFNDVTTKAMKFREEQNNSCNSMRLVGEQCEKDWVFEGDDSRKEKQHEPMFSKEDIRQVPKKKDVLNEYGADKFDEQSLVRTRESLLEIKNLCSPDSLALKKKSRFADIEEESENYDALA